MNQVSIETLSILSRLQGEMQSNGLGLGLETEISVCHSLTCEWVFVATPSPNNKKPLKPKATFFRAGSGNIVFINLWWSGELFAGCKVRRDLSTQL